MTLSRDFGALGACWLAGSDRLALFRFTAAAVLGQEAEQFVHRLEPRGIDHRATLATYRDKAREAQSVKMEGERIRREIESRRDGARRHAFRSSLNQKAENIEAVLLRESGQCGQNVLLLHTSTDIEMSLGVKGEFR